jgi:hypothetical protein
MGVFEMKDTTDTARSTLYNGLIVRIVARSDSIMANQAMMVSEVMTSILPLGSVVFLLEGILSQGKLDRNTTSRTAYRARYIYSIYCYYVATYKLKSKTPGATRRTETPRP